MHQTVTAVLLVLQWMFDVGFWTQNLWNAYVTILLLGLRGDWSWHLGGENLQITLHIYCTGKKQRYISVVQRRTATHWNSSASSTTQHRAELSNQSSHHQLRIINICSTLIAYYSLHILTQSGQGVNRTFSKEDISFLRPLEIKMIRTPHPRKES